MSAWALANPYLTFWLVALLLCSLKLSFTWGGSKPGGAGAKVLEEAITSLEASRTESRKAHSEATYASGLQCRYAGQLDAYGQAVEVLRALQVRELGFVSGGDSG